MNKIRLNLDRLDVESFPTASTPAGARGTVRANAETDWELYTCGLRRPPLPPHDGVRRVLGLT